MSSSSKKGMIYFNSTIRIRTMTKKRPDSTIFNSIKASMLYFLRIFCMIKGNFCFSRNRDICLTKLSIMYKFAHILDTLSFTLGKTKFGMKTDKSPLIMTSNQLSKEKLIIV